MSSESANPFKGFLETNEEENLTTLNNLSQVNLVNKVINPKIISDVPTEEHQKELGSKPTSAVEPESIDDLESSSLVENEANAANLSTINNAPSSSNESTSILIEENILSPSNANIFKNFAYQSTDDGPYKVIIEFKNKNGQKYNINKLVVAKILKNLGCTNELLDIKKTGIHKVTAFFETAENANMIITNLNLAAHNYIAYIPRHFISVTGIVTGIPTNISTEEILEDCSAGDVPIIDVYRLTRFVNNKKTMTNKVAIVFRTDVLPEYIKILRVRCHVQPFFSKVLFCEKCLRYNHKTTSCKSSAVKCNICCATEHAAKDCTYRPFCFHCKENHKVNDQDCRERFKQNHIKFIMAHKKLTYREILDEYHYFANVEFNLFERSNEFPDIHESFQRSPKKITTPQNKPSSNIITEPDNNNQPLIRNKKSSLKGFKKEAYLNIKNSSMNFPEIIIKLLS